MALYRLDGTITRLGQCEFDNNVVIYAYVEITDVGGRRTLVKKAAVSVDVESALTEGLAGSFFFDDLFISGRRFLSQLWAVSTAERTVVDGVDMRRALARIHVLRGIIFTPLFGVGLIELVPGLCQWWSLVSGSGNRRRFFETVGVTGHPAKLPHDLEKELPLPERVGSRLRQFVVDAVRKRLQQVNR